MSGRKAARRTALFVLYQSDVTGQPLAALYEGEIDAFARALADGVAARADELDRRITGAAVGWPAERLGALERNILRIGLYELERTDDPAHAVEVLRDLAELAREVQAEVEQARREAHDALG